MDVKQQSLIDQVNRISPLNPVMLDLLAALQNRDSEVSDLKRIIEPDANTSASILKIANSPFYGLSGKIKSIRDACVLLGYDQLKNIIYASALSQATHKGPHSEWRQTLRSHTLATAIVCKELEKHTAVERTGDGYASGLLHELGKQVMLAEFPDYFSEYMLNTEDGETQHFVDLFIEVGDVLAKRWHLPEVMRACIRNYRTPECAQEEFSETVKLVHYAHYIATDQGYPSPGDITADHPHEVVYPELITSLIPPIAQNLNEIMEQSAQAKR